MMRRDERFARIWRAGTRAQMLWYLVSKGTKVLLSVLVPLIAQLFMIFFAAYFRFLTVSSAFSAVPVLACVPRNQRPNTLLPTHTHNLLYPQLGRWWHLEITKLPVRGANDVLAFSCRRFRHSFPLTDCLQSATLSR